MTVRILDSGGKHYRLVGAAAPTEPTIPFGFPNTSDTGYLSTGVTLTPYSGPNPVTVAALGFTPTSSSPYVIDSVSDTSSLTINAPYVIVKRSSLYQLKLNGSATNFHAEDTEIHQLDNSSTGATLITNGHAATFLRMNIHDSANFAYLYGNETFTDCFFHDLYTPNVLNVHPDGFQYPANITATGTTFEHCTMLANITGTSNNGNSVIHFGNGSITNFLCDDCFITGGQYCFQLTNSAPQSGFAFTNNIFGRLQNHGLVSNSGASQIATWASAAGPGANYFTDGTLALRTSGGGAGGPGTPPTVTIATQTPSTTGVSQAMTATATLEPGATVASYAWLVTARPTGSTASLTGTSSQTATFVGDVAGDYSFQCTVTDADGRTGHATAHVHISGVMFGVTGNGSSQASNSTWDAQNTKYGNTVPAWRVYDKDAPTFTAPSDLLTGACRIVYSFKGNHSDPIGASSTLQAGTWDSDIHTTLLQYPVGTVVYATFWHEPENDFASNTASYQAAMQYLHTLVAGFTDLHCTVIVGSIFTAYDCFGGGTYVADNYWPTGYADFIGIDADGIDATGATANHDFRGAVSAGFTYGSGKGVKHLLVCEFGQSRISTDTTGSVRTAWMEQQIPAFVADGAETVVLYDSTENGDYEWAGPELTYWQSLVATSDANL